MREQFKKTIHDAFVVPFGEHDIATPAEILSPPSTMRKTATKRSKRSRRRPPSAVSVARSVVSTVSFFSCFLYCAALLFVPSIIRLFNLAILTDNIFLASSTFATFGI